MTNGTPRVAVNASGGLDSSLLLAALREAGEVDCESFSMAFERPHSDDPYWAERVPEDLGIAHNSLIVDGRDYEPEFMVGLLKQFDEPCSAHNAVADYVLSRAAADRGFSSSLTGDRADSAFGGIGTWRRMLGHIDAGEIKTDEDRINCAFKHSLFIDFDEQAKLLAPAFRHGPEVVERYLGAYREILPEDTAFNFVTSVVFVRGSCKSITNHLVPPLLGVESRLGFGGFELLEFGRSIPGELRSEHAKKHGRGLLASAYGHIIPSAFERTVVGGKPGVLPPSDFTFAAIRLLKKTGLFVPEEIERLLSKLQERSGQDGQSLYMKL